MKKKILIASLVVAVIAIAVVGGSLAWFTDNDSVENVFTIGSVEIEQHEQQKNELGELVDFEQNKQLIPVINNDDAKNDVNFQDKIVTVENTGKNDAYVQTYVAVPASLDNAGVVHIYDKEASTNGWEKVADVDTATDGVQPCFADVDIDGKKYNVYLYRYTNILPANSAALSTTASVIDGVYIDMATDLDIIRDETTGDITEAYFVINGTKVTDFDPTGNLYVYVATQGIQAKGFNDYESALTSGFGTGINSLPDFSVVNP